MGSTGSEATAVTNSYSESTLNEPIRATIMRDVNSIKTKFQYIIFQSKESVEGVSKEWDLWGPFVLCLVLSVILAAQAPENQKGYVFALVYIFVWAGSAVVTFNAVLLKARVSLFQTVCVLGYCFLPLVLSALVGWGLNRFLSGTLNLALKAAAIGVGLIWSTKASVGFMSALVPEDRKALAVYPVWLLYVAMSWIIFLS